MCRVCYSPIRINGIEEIRICGAATRGKHLKKILGSIKSVTKDAGPGPKIFEPTYM